LACVVDFVYKEHGGGVSFYLISSLAIKQPMKSISKRFEKLKEFFFLPENFPVRQFYGHEMCTKQ